MSTDLHAALREAVADAPFDDADLRSVLDAGARRVHRRTVARAGLGLLAVAAVVVGLVVRGDRPVDPQPADVVRLDLGSARQAHPDVLASTRTMWRDEPDADLSHDQLLGLTADGKVLRSRYDHGTRTEELGLLDPETGTTDWLPPPPTRGLQPVELSADRLVLARANAGSAGANAGSGTIAVLERGARTWASSSIRVRPGLEAHSPFQLRLGNDGRLYLGSSMEREAESFRWWAYDVREGGPGRLERSWEGSDVAWEDGTGVRAYNDGRVVVTNGGAERVVTTKRPSSCPRPNEPGLAAVPPTARLAGGRPVVTLVCGDEPAPNTYVRDVDHDQVVEVPGAAVLAAHGDQVLLAGDGSHPGAYVLDLRRVTLARLGRSTFEPQADVADGLVLWNHAGPAEGDDVYDVVWKVARLPLDD
jgi:hypothetical protein